LSTLRRDALSRPRPVAVSSDKVASSYNDLVTTPDDLPSGDGGVSGTRRAATGGGALEVGGCAAGAVPSSSLLTGAGDTAWDVFFRDLNHKAGVINAERLASLALDEVIAVAPRVSATPVSADGEDAPALVASSGVLDPATVREVLDEARRSSWQHYEKSFTVRLDRLRKKKKGEVSAEVEDDQVSNERRRRRYDNRELLWRHSDLKRVRACGRRKIDKEKPVVLKVGDGRGHYSGVQRCGAIWTEPCCSAKIREYRSKEVVKAGGKHIKAGGEVWGATFTLRHGVFHRLADLMKALTGSFRKMLRGGSWQKLRKSVGMTGTIRSVEVTYGGLNGWHPHLHVLFFVGGAWEERKLPRKKDRPEGWKKPEREPRPSRYFTPDPGDLARFMGYVEDKWAQWLASFNVEYTPNEHGVKWDKVIRVKEAGEYICKTQDGTKIGPEVARGDLKSGRLGNVTPFELLDYVRLTGDMDALEIWHEYERATGGHHAIEWSPGLRKACGLGDEELSDEEVAEAEVGGEDVAVIPDGSWKKITATPGLSLKVLEAAESGGFPGVARLLAPYRIYVYPPPDVGPPRDSGSNPPVPASS
jgi:hypothetical protein